MWQVTDFALIEVIHCANSCALHAYHGSDVYSYAYGLLCHCSLNFLGKERVRFPITDEHSSLAAFTKKFAEFAVLKAEAKKRGLGSCVELKFCRLEKGKDGSKAFAINSQEQWDEERPLLSGNTSSWSLQGRNLFTVLLIKRHQGPFWKTRTDFSIG